MIGAIDPFWASVVGTLVGGTIVVTGQLVTGWLESKRGDRRTARERRISDLLLLQDLAGEYVDLAGERVLWASKLPGPPGRTPVDEIADRTRVMFRMRGATARISDPRLDECVIEFLEALGDEWIEIKAKDPNDDTAADAIAALHERIGHLMREL